MEEEQNNSKKNCLKVKIHIAHIAKHIVKVLHLDSVPFVRSSVALFTFSRFVSFYFVYGAGRRNGVYGVGISSSVSTKIAFESISSIAKVL